MQIIHRLIAPHMCFQVDYPSFLPAEKITQLEEPAVLDCLRRYKLETLKYNGESVDTAFIPPLSSAPPSCPTPMPGRSFACAVCLYPRVLHAASPPDRPALRKHVRVHAPDGSDRPSLLSSLPPASAGLPPLILLHGFDSSSLEFRRLLPLLGEVGIEAWAMDILGNGFTTATDPARFDTAPLGPKDRSQHIQAFLEQKARYLTLGSHPVVPCGCLLACGRRVRRFM